MRKSLLAAAVSTFALTGPALADAPSVAVDIAPVHSLVAQVMQGVGEPDLIVQSGATPHGYSLRPSEAEALQQADIVFWVSDDLAPWIEESIDSLAGDAQSVELIETEGTTTLEYREGPTFEGHSHGHDEHDHAAHEDHDHEGHDHEGHDEHGHDEHGHGHHHHGLNPHAWLDPQNAQVWLDVIAERLAELDPEHAEAYAANAAQSKAELETLTGDIDAKLEPFRGTNFVVFHDAYQYFENRFGIAAAGAIRLGDASDPGPARIAEIRDKVAELNVKCVFAEPQFNPGMIDTVFEGTEANVGVLDPLGSELTPGADLYPQLLRNLADNLSSCL